MNTYANPQPLCSKTHRMDKNSQISGRRCRPIKRDCAAYVFKNRGTKPKRGQFRKVGEPPRRDQHGICFQSYSELVF